MTALVLIATLLASGDADKARFRELFTEGEARYQRGDYPGSIAPFREADAIKATPEVAFDLAQSYQKIGDAASAVRCWRLYLNRAPHAPDGLEIAERIAGELAREKTLGRGLLLIDATGAINQLPEAEFRAAGPLDIEARFREGTSKQTVHVVAGEVTEVSLRPPPIRAASRSDDWADDASSPPTVTASVGGSGGLRKASYVVLAIGASALIAGTAFGAMARDDAGRLDRTRPTLSTPQAQALADSANGRGNAANWLWASGGAALAGGGLMFVFSGP